MTLHERLFPDLSPNGTDGFPGGAAGVSGAPAASGTAYAADGFWSGGAYPAGTENGSDAAENAHAASGAPDAADGLPGGAAASGSAYAADGFWSGGAYPAGTENGSDAAENAHAASGAPDGMDGAALPDAELPRGSAPEGPENPGQALWGSFPGNLKQVQDDALAALSAERDALRLAEAERVFREDLEAIRRYAPQERAASVRELGRAYITARAMGMSAVTAYELARMERAAAAGRTPPGIGGVQSGAPDALRDFYTPEEVDLLTEAELDDPRVMERVMRSMRSW